MIKGKTVGLRAVEKDDLERLKDWRNNTSLRKNFREYRELNTANQEAWFSRINNSTTDIMFMIVRLNDHKPLGACGLLYINWILRSSDFSLYIGDEDKYIDDSGYAKEAAQLLIDYAFRNLNLHKLWMEIYEFDKKKFEFFTKEFNFSVDGTLRDNCFEEGRYWNSKVVSLLSDELRR